MTVVWYAVIAAVVVGVGALLWGVLPLLRRIRPLLDALGRLRARRTEVAAVVDRINQLNRDLTRIQAATAQIRFRAEASPLRRGNRRRARSDRRARVG